VSVHKKPRSISCGIHNTELWSAVDVHYFIYLGLITELLMYN